jgi:glycosyltransferase involved in cell wall biosynthesis
VSALKTVDTSNYIDKAITIRVATLKRSQTIFIKMPKVSITITTYNREKYLEQAIASILAQTYKDLEVILFDDGSSDRSVEIAEQYALQDSRIKLVASPHIGRIPALIAASALVTGEYACVVDSDDWISLNAIADTAAVLDSRPEIGMAYTNCMLVDSLGSIIGCRKQNQIPYSRDRLLTDFIPFHLRMYRQSLFEQVGGYDSTLEYAEDYDLSLKLSEITEAAFVPTASYYYRQHSQTQGAKCRIERIYWTKKAIERSLLRTNDPRRIDVAISRANFSLVDL